MSNNPDFTTMDYETTFPPVNEQQWRERVEEEAGMPFDQLIWQTMEQIDVKPLYTGTDIEALEHLGYTAGIPLLPPQPGRRPKGAVHCL